MDLINLHKLGYSHKDFHSGNILKESEKDYSFISDFGLSGPPNEQKSDDKICGVLPYIAPEVLNGEPYTLSSDIYSFGVVMAELSSGKPPFYKRKHDASLALAICNGLRPEFGKGTPEIYKKLTYRCMDANPNNRPTADEIREIIGFWYHALHDTNNLKERHEYSDKKINEMKFIRKEFEEMDKIEFDPSTAVTATVHPNAVYTSRLLNFTNLPQPVNSNRVTIISNNNGNYLIYLIQTSLLLYLL